MSSNKQQRKQGELIRYLINCHGGISKLSRELGDTRLLTHNWIVRKRVPLKEVYRMAKIFKCDPLVLNFEELSYQLMSSKTWNEAIDNSKCLKGVRSDFYV